MDLAPRGGLAINQLLKLKAKGLISTQQFCKLTADMVGEDEERPIEVGIDQTTAAHTDAMDVEAGSAARTFVDISRSEAGSSVCCWTCSIKAIFQYICPYLESFKTISNINT